jgi:hypothetical protein
MVIASLMVMEARQSLMERRSLRLAPQLRPIPAEPGSKDSSFDMYFEA